MDRKVKAHQCFLSDFLSDINHVIAKLPHFWTIAKPRYQLYSCLTDLILQLMQIKQIFIFSGENQSVIVATLSTVPLGLPHIYLILGMQPHQGVRERARVPQFVMLCHRWAHLQCFVWRTGRNHGTTAGYCFAGNHAQYHNIRPLEKI